MTTYTAIPDADLEPDKPFTSQKALLLRDNPIAIAEGASGAPRIQNAAMDTDSVDNANVVNGTLGAEKFQTGNTERDWVLARTADAAAGAVGTYVFAESDSDHALGGTVSGSSLTPTGAIYNIDITSSTASASLTRSGSLSGTWRCMGYHDNTNAGSNMTIFGATLFLRIS